MSPEFTSLTRSTLGLSLTLNSLKANLLVGKNFDRNAVDPVSAIQKLPRLNRCTNFDEIWYRCRWYPKLTHRHLFISELNHGAMYIFFNINYYY